MRPDPKFSPGDYVRLTLGDTSLMNVTGVIREGEWTGEWSYTVEFVRGVLSVVMERFLRRARIDE